MKLVAVMSLDAYRDDLHALLRERQIEVFSEIDIEGHHHAPSGVDSASVGWFGGGPPPTDSTLTWAFLDDDQADDLLSAVVDFNERRSLDRPVRAFEMDVARAV
jgi:hypothetical protein